MIVCIHSEDGRHSYRCGSAQAADGLTLKCSR